MCLLQISMVDGGLFDASEALARGIRGNQEPFGGIQLILAGEMSTPFQTRHAPFYIGFVSFHCMLFVCTACNMQIVFIDRLLSSDQRSRQFECIRCCAPVLSIQASVFSAFVVQMQCFVHDMNITA